MKWFLFFLTAVVLTGCSQSGGYKGKDQAVMTKPGLKREEYRSRSMEMERKSMAPMADFQAIPPREPGADLDRADDRETYDAITENTFLPAASNQLSTFSIDVDTASYANVRRFVSQGSLPPVDSVRIEELVNYFPYDYPNPEASKPFSINTSIAQCPWKQGNVLVRIGLKGRTVMQKNMPPNNLVFLIDVSGSMGSENKLPLLKQAFKLLVEQMRPQDRVAIVVYAGAAGLVLPSTSGSDKGAILAALDRLSSGGSTAGGAGLLLAYKVAKENYMQQGNNRVILASDGDFNVGSSTPGQMEKMVEERRKDGIYMTVLGFGMGNYRDNMMETIADKGNGNYYYIDSFEEARKVLVYDLSATLLTIAGDVKIQVVFNTNRVESYRLIGYENRRLKNEDFTNDTKDAGEIGAGHTVTALYEIVPRGAGTGEWMRVDLRYKNPGATNSLLLTASVTSAPVAFAAADTEFRFAASVAGFGMLLRKSAHKGSLTWPMVLDWARASRGQDQFGYRKGFIELAEKASALDKK